MRVAIAYPAFVSAFKEAYPELVIFNPTKHSVKDFQLIIFPGGEDVNPSIYGESNTFSSYNEDRDRIELSILEKCWYSHVKILGVCRGHQLIAAFNGTKLIQDIFYFSKKRHEGEHFLDYYTEKSLVKFALNGEHVNSLHHQGYSPAHSKLSVTSGYNGIAESVESEFILTVQFHPEFFDGEKKTNFFNVVNKWVENRDGLISEITKFFKLKSKKEPEAMKSSIHLTYEEHMARMQEQTRAANYTMDEVGNSTASFTISTNNATTISTDNLPRRRMAWQPLGWNTTEAHPVENNSSDVENSVENNSSEEIFFDEEPEETNN